MGAVSLFVQRLGSSPAGPEMLGRSLSQQYLGKDLE
jgi:hypothetical protein